MFFTSKKKYLAEDAREINIGDDCNLPQLHRLNADFGFIVVGLNGSTSTPKEYVLCEVGLEGTKSEDVTRVTPKFQSLSELETYTAANVVGILNKYLFGDNMSDDIQLAV